MENDSENTSLCGFEEPREEDQSLYGYMELSQEEADVRKTFLECVDQIDQIILDPKIQYTPKQR